MDEDDFDDTELDDAAIDDLFGSVASCRLTRDT